METSHNSVEGPQRSNLPSRDQYSNHQRTERTSPPVRHARESTAFHHRVDRHGNPFGKRAATYQSRAPPLKNKITPTLEREPPRHSGTERSPTRRNEVTDNSPQYSTRRTGPNRRHLNQNTTSPTEQQLTNPPQQSKRRGRPPKARDLRISPKVFKGSNSRKRNIQISVASLANSTGRASTPSGRAARRKAAP
ncbi:hypothetical protein IGI04_001724, partial [Brassica rapa subsp. trilocularis]